MIAKAGSVGYAVLIGCLLVIVVLKTRSVRSGELPFIPPYTEMVSWQPQSDRTLEVAFENVSFRYSILDNKPAPNCQAVTELVGQKEIRWVKNTGFFAHQYLTRSAPMMYRWTGEADWNRMNLKTYKEN